MGGLVGVAQWAYRAWLCRSEILCASFAIHDGTHNLRPRLRLRFLARGEVTIADGEIGSVFTAGYW